LKRVLNLIQISFKNINDYGVKNKHDLTEQAILYFIV